MLRLSDKGFKAAIIRKKGKGKGRKGSISNCEHSWNRGIIDEKFQQRNRKYKLEQNCISIGNLNFQVRT